MNLDDHLTICIGHVEGWASSFAEFNPTLVSEELLLETEHLQRGLDFREESQSRTSDVLPSTEVEEIWIAIAKNINFAKKRKQEDERMAWSALMHASKLIGRLEPVEDYRQVADEANEFDVELKAKAIELFALQRPLGGWRKYSEACRVIYEDLLRFHEEAALIKTPNLDLSGRLKRWGKEPIFGAAFEAQSAAMETRRNETSKRFR